MDVRFHPERNSYSFTDFKAPLLMNQIRGMKWFVYQKHIDEYHDDMGWAIKTSRVEPMDKVKIIVRHTFKKDEPDTLACAPAVKACVDSLVTMGVLIDDSPQFVTEIRFIPPKKTGVNSLDIEVIPI